MTDIPIESYVVAGMFSLLFMGIGYFVKSYLTEKGKSLATKEDVAHITEQVESVKTAFAHETEKMKSVLQLGNAKKQLVTQEKLRILISFSEKYYFWYTMCTSGSLFKIDCRSASIVDEEKEKYSQAYFEVRMAESKIKMFVYDKELLISIGECIGNTLQLNHEFERAIEAMHMTEMNYAEIPEEQRNRDAYYKRKSEILDAHRASISKNRQLFLNITHSLAENYRRYFDTF